ncbi:MAG TPA: transcriptional regulator [Quisquiliibacterium sp.]|nr:transcriptional regulator [Quisquiliibacterium sp.]HPA91770.1 transcriptional regulator [Quisquiliibacterium sp.]HQN13394.1 transcriptional regulator [Quisquiliibacterium sp.]HQP66997.1 transcriptional regulator [Quisquiliibacterium sp.]
MDKHPRRLVVIVTEAVLERTLVTDARRLGAQGYTVHDVRGGGAHGDHDGEWDADRSIQLQLICPDGVADRIAEHVLAHYAPNYRVAVWLAPVEVFRADRY